MDRDSSSPVPEKMEEQSGSILLTYFRGDIGSMVDAHFSRALSKASKADSNRAKSKGNGRAIKTEETSSSHWTTQSPTWLDSSFSSASAGQIHLTRNEVSQRNPSVSLHPPGETSLWSSSQRKGANLALPPTIYSASVPSDSFAVGGRQYTTSLLNLLHSERPDLNSVMVTSAKQELVPGWSAHPTFREHVNPDVSLDSGIQVPEKKDLYWY